MGLLTVQMSGSYPRPTGSESLGELTGPGIASKLLREFRGFAELDQQCATGTVASRILDPRLSGSSAIMIHIKRFLFLNSGLGKY